jgi:hypothetical protein
LAARARTEAVVIPKRWLGSARAVVLAWFVFSLIWLIWSLPFLYESRRHLAPSTLSGSAFYGWTPQQLNSVAAELGINPDLAAGALLAASLVCLASFLGMACLLFWRRSDTWMGLLAAFTLFAAGPGFSGLLLNETQIPLWARTLYTLSAALIWPTLFVVMLYLFPSGQFVPRFTRYLAVVPYLLFGTNGLAASSPLLTAIFKLLAFAYLLLGLVSQIYRYRKVSTAEERQQTKWLVFVWGILIGDILFVQLGLPLFPSLAIGTQSRFLFEWIPNGIFAYLLPALIPLSIAVAILRYRLWDIDVIIRRTLVYAALTGLLALAYFGSILVLQNIFGALTGQQQSTLVTVLSTLVIAALFVPLRRRVQAVIDRRLYRRKYDAARTLAVFGASVRDEVEMDALTERLLGVVDETMQPASVGFWLRAPERRPP